VIPLDPDLLCLLALLWTSGCILMGFLLGLVMAWPSRDCRCRREPPPLKIHYYDPIEWSPGTWNRIMGEDDVKP
jgi:hypothetical protein